ncbi:Cold shock protein CspD [Salmonella enterica subsp. enterica serovar Hvittingfoss str. A4-620]|nr:Cold shock protein CspD [Salmonella enterica subsp. enterica serovar Hvittingfoss str. A4-620]
METGTVKWFNNAKGFGFICPEGGGEDIFAHYSTIQMDGYRTLKAGQSVRMSCEFRPVRQSVRFDVHQGPKGNHASVIVPIEAEAVA